MHELSQADINEVSGGKDCTFAGATYSKGSVIKMDDGKNYVCSGDDDGAWNVKK